MRVTFQREATFIKPVSKFVLEWQVIKNRNGEKVFSIFHFIKKNHSHDSEIVFLSIKMNICSSSMI